MEPRYEHYRSFVLRIWRGGEHNNARWYVSLVDPINGEQTGFPEIESLTDYIQELIAQDLGPNDAPTMGEEP